MPVTRDYVFEVSLQNRRKLRSILTKKRIITLKSFTFEDSNTYIVRCRTTETKFRNVLKLACFGFTIYGYIEDYGQDMQLCRKIRKVVISN